MKKRILTGIRPTGPLHLGHYAGMLQLTASLQDEYDTFFMIADVQALTDNFDNPQKVKDNILEVLCDCIAAGIDPQKTTIFLQSEVREIAELTLYLANLVTINRLERNPTVKAEIAQKKELFGKGGVTYGFLGYPVNQAADITIFDADLVPVGEDQAPQVEQTRELVRKFNSIYGPVLREPDIKLSEIPRLSGLDGNAKMSKSLGNAVYLGDEDQTILDKVKQGKTDPAKIHKDSPGNPDICQIYSYHSLFNTPAAPTVYEECSTGKRGCVDCKKELSCALSDLIKPLREKRTALYQDQQKTLDILRAGTKKARSVAAGVMDRVRASMKLDILS